MKPLWNGDKYQWWWTAGGHEDRQRNVTVSTVISDHCDRRWVKRETSAQEMKQGKGWANKRAENTSSPFVSNIHIHNGREWIMRPAGRDRVLSLCCLTLAVSPPRWTHPSLCTSAFTAGPMFCRTAPDDAHVAEVLAASLFLAAANICTALCVLGNDAKVFRLNVTIFIKQQCLCGGENPPPLGEVAFKVPASFCLSHGAFRGLQMFSKWRGGQGGERLRSLMPACVLD